MIDVYERDYTIGFSAVDRSGALSPRAVIEFFDETAVSHAESLGLGYSPMLARGQAWVLSRISIVIDERPRRGDTVTVRTWPRGADRLFVIRDYEIAASGRTVIRARADWLILDLEKRRPVRPDTVLALLPPNEGRNALDEHPPALEAAPARSLWMERPARYSDLDFNGHVNYTRYLEWICDLFEPETIEKAARFRFDINYMKEITASSVTSLWTAPLPDAAAGADAGTGETGAWGIDGRQGDDVMFRARVLFNQA